VTAIYELPFGRGKQFGSNWKGLGSRVVSGWQVSGIYQGQSGPALGFGNALFYGDIKDIPIPNDQRTVNRWFNTDGFERSTALQLSQNLQTLSTRFSGIRGDGANNLDLSLLKNIAIREGLNLQFRIDSINALNHAQFLPPNTTPTSSAFGQVTGSWASPRTVLLAAKLIF